jgi:hypothetical protein
MLELLNQLDGFEASNKIKVGRGRRPGAAPAPGASLSLALPVVARGAEIPTRTHTRAHAPPRS